MTNKLFPWFVAGLMYLLFPAPSEAICVVVNNTPTEGCKSGDSTQSTSGAPGDAVPVQTICMGGKCAYVGNQPGTAGSTPDGWSGPSSPPSTASTVHQFSNSGEDGQGGTIEAACADMVAKVNADATPNHPAATYPWAVRTTPPGTGIDAFGTPYCIMRPANYPTNNEVGGSYSLACPAGYSLSGGRVQSDKRLRRAEAARWQVQHHPLGQQFRGRCERS